MVIEYPKQSESRKPVEIREHETHARFPDFTLKKKKKSKIVKNVNTQGAEAGGLLQVPGYFTVRDIQPEGPAHGRH